ncbi:hypothetical protein CH06BL_21830 [Chromobacterium haemolyticum]|nr:hypothetical protein CH06BL_21830 [Chromobacterium haemolyticum]
MSQCLAQRLVRSLERYALPLSVISYQHRIMRDTGFEEPHGLGLALVKVHLDVAGARMIVSDHVRPQTRAFDRIAPPGAGAH